MSKEPEIIKAARSWIGTSFHHQGRKKKQAGDDGGCDCLGLIIGICKELNIGSGIADTKTGKEIPFAYFDPQVYRKCPDGHAMLTILQKIAIEIENEDLSPGDLLLFSIFDNPQHLAILSNKASIIHCLEETKGVVETHFHQYWHKMLYKSFRLRPRINQ